MTMPSAEQALFAVFSFCTLASCAGVKLVADYDAEAAKAITTPHRNSLSHKPSISVLNSVVWLKVEFG